MDQGTAQIAEDLKDLVQTRAAIADKLGLIERRLTQSVEEAKTKAEQVVLDTQASIRSAVHTIKRVTNPSRIASTHPWLMVAGAMLVGYAAGQVQHRGNPGVMPYYPPGSQGAPVMPPPGRKSDSRPGVYPSYPETDSRSRTPPISRASLLGDLGQVLTQGLGQAREELIQTAQSVFRGWLQDVLRKTRSAS